MNGRRARGFTLLEAVVAITIFSLVITVLYAGFRLGVRSWDSGERTHAAVSELRLVGGFVRDYVAQAFPLTVNMNNTWQLFFEGDEQHLVFVTPMPVHLGEGGMYEMTLSMDDRTADTVLMTSRRLMHPDVERGMPGIDDPPRVLLEHLESARFDFFGAHDNEAEETWQSRWVDSKRLPSLVRLRLKSKLAGDWPDIIIRLPTNAVRYQRSAVQGGPGRAGAGRAPSTAVPSLLAPSQN